MATNVVTEVGILATTDDANVSSGTYNVTGQVWYWVGRNTSSSSSPYNTYRFKIPTSVDPSRITDVRLRLVAATTGSVAARVRVNQSAANAPASTGDDNPSTKWTAIGSTGEVDWTFTANANGNVFDSPDISSRVVSALANIDQATEYIGIHTGPNSSSWTLARIQMYCRDYTTNPAWRPLLVITESVPDLDASVTVSAPSMATTPGDSTAYTKHTAVSYHDSIGSSTRRELDLYIPVGTAPAGGWPVVMFIHGGAFAQGDRTAIPSSLPGRLASQGFATASISYKLTANNYALNTNTGSNRPSAVQDAICAMKWLTKGAGASTYNLADHLLVMSESAGGHIALEAALALDDANRDTYTMTYSGASGTERRTAYNSSTSLDFTQGRTNLPTVKGVWLWAPPIKLTGTFSHAVVGYLICVYYGALPQTLLYGSTVGYEGDLNSYISGDDASIYAARTPTAPSFPMAIMQDTNDIVVVPANGLTPLQSALSTTSYDQSSGNGEVNTNGGLTYFSYAGSGHDYAYSATNWTKFYEWLDSIPTGGTDGGATVTAPTAASFSVPAVTISVDKSVTVTAPTAASFTPGTHTPSIVVDRSVTVAAPGACSFTAGAHTPSVVVDRSVTVAAPSPVVVTPGTHPALTTKSITVSAPGPFATTPGSHAASVSRTITVTAPAALTLGTGTHLPSVVADNSVTVGAVSSSYTTGTATALVTTTGEAQVAATVFGTAAGEVTLELPRSVQVSAPSTGSAAGGHTALIEVGATVAASSAGFSTGTVVVSISKSTTVGGVSFGTTTGEATAQVSTTGNVAVAAVTTSAAAGAPAVTVDGAAIAAGVSFGTQPGTHTVSVGRVIEAQAPAGAGFTVGTATVSIVSNASVQVVAPGTGFSTGQAQVSTAASRNVQAVGQSDSYGTGTVGVTTYSYISVDVSAPVISNFPGAVTISVSTTATITAPSDQWLAATGFGVTTDSTITVPASSVSFTAGPGTVEVGIVGGEVEVQADAPAIGFTSGTARLITYITFWLAEGGDEVEVTAHWADGLGAEVPVLLYEAPEA